VEQILEKLESGARPTGQLKILRAVEVLEWIGSAEARQVLLELAQGTGESWLRQEAKAALAGRISERWRVDRFGCRSTRRP
jgi:hypothetical protein